MKRNGNYTIFVVQTNKNSVGGTGFEAINLNTDNEAQCLTTCVRQRDAVARNNGQYLILLMSFFSKNIHHIARCSYKHNYIGM